MTYWRRALRSFKPDSPQILAAVVFLLLGAIANVLKPWPIGILLDSILGTKPLPAWFPDSIAQLSKTVLLAWFAALIFILHGLQGAFFAAHNFLSIRAGLRGLARVRQDLFELLQRLSLRFFQRTNQGDLIYRATWDTYAFQTLFQQGLFRFLSAFLSLALMVAVMWRVNSSLTLLMLAIFPPVFAVMFFLGRAMNKRSLAAHEADSKVTSLVQQNISALPLVQSYTQEPRERSRFASQVDRSLQHRTAQHRLEVTYWLLIALLFGLGTAGLTWWGAQEILAQRLTLGELVVFLAYLGQLYEPLNQLTHVGATVSDASAGVQRIFEIMDSKEEVPESTHPHPILSPRARTGRPGAVAVQGEISFEHVAFGYVAERPVLSEVSFNVKPGETVAIIGPSGAGKTTLLNLLPRFFDPTAGRILLDGVDLRDLPLRELRENVALVFQDPLLLPGTIADNIGYGRVDATQEEIVAAARAANAHDFIVELPQGYATVVGEGAARLSAGERQRINLARAFLKDAPILLLDEPTSALDAESEQAVVAGLLRLMQNRTTLMVAHRLSSVQAVNRIIVLENGRIVQTGTPAELRRTAGYFARVSAVSFGKI